MILLILLVSDCCIIFTFFIRFVGVGLEELGVEEFVKGKFFDGGNKHNR